MPSPNAPPDIASDIAAIGRIEAVPTMLRVLCETTGMGFAAVARVTDGSWTACAVHDAIAFGLGVGGELDVDTTLCKEARLARKPVVIDRASTDPVYFDHHTPKLYDIESYISVPIVLPNGEYFGNLCAIDPRPAHVSEPRIVATVELFAQLIALQLQNERRRAQADQALLDEREVGELREQFIAVLGHDLRNPLAAISACGQLIAKRPDHADIVANAAARIGTNVRRMTALIGDVLDLARGRLGGGFQLRLAQVDDLGSALAGVVAELSDAHPDRAIESRIQIAASVRCDAGRLQQLASNLIANALTHGTKDEPVVFFAQARGEMLVIEVVNSGAAIPASDMARIFEPFQRQATSSQPEGLGLGLYICEQIVKAHEGTLVVGSDDEDRIRFTATIPLAGPAAGRSAAHEPR